ncbi:MAG: hypothetical protein M0Z94_14150 [Dehalococcoidales bacterium]|nr:hypothetical protein [Dehalococcoidales bacterium]
MGAKPDEVVREIENLRADSDVIIDELTRRLTPSSVARNLRGAVTRRVEDTADTLGHEAQEVARDVADEVDRATPEIVRRNPTVAAGAALGVVAGASAALATNLIRTWQEAHEPQASIRRSRLALRRAGRRNLYRLRNVDLGGAALGAVQGAEGGESRMVRRLAWVAMFSVMGALGAMLFQNLAADLWRRTTHEEPPKR